MPKDLLTAAWKLLFLRGVIGIVLGIILVAWPQATIVVLMVLIGIWALIDGIGLAAQVFAKGAGTGQRVLFGVMALVALVVALVERSRRRSDRSSPSSGALRPRRRSRWATTRATAWPARSGRGTRAGRTGWPRRCATARCGSTTSGRTSRGRSGVA